MVYLLSKSFSINLIIIFTIINNIVYNTIIIYSMLFVYLLFNISILYDCSMFQSLIIFSPSSFVINQLQILISSIYTCLIQSLSNISCQLSIPSYCRYFIRYVFAICLLLFVSLHITYEYHNLISLTFNYQSVLIICIYIFFFFFFYHSLYHFTGIVIVIMFFFFLFYLIAILLQVFYNVIF